jgi:bacillopeptidase F (M6 metalloprotease family)
MTLSTINWDLEGWSDTDSVRISEDMKKIYEKYAKAITISIPRSSGKSVVDVWAKMQLNSVYGIGVGKSMYYTQSKYRDNLCKEIIMPTVWGTKPKSKYKFSRAKWYEADYDWIHYDEVRAWCTEQFGKHDIHPDAWSRWDHKYEGKIFFRDEKDYTLFLLRW